MNRLTIGDVVITLAFLVLLVVVALVAAVLLPLVGFVAVAVALVRAARAGWCVCRRPGRADAPAPIRAEDDPIPDYVGFDAPRVRCPVECIAWHVAGRTEAEIAHRALMEVLA